jgi:hypothetical protein
VIAGPTARRPRIVALAAALALHAIAIVFWPTRIRMPHTDGSDVADLVFIEVPDVVTRSLQLSEPTIVAPAPSAPVPADTQESSRASPPPAANAPRQIDWNAEAGRAATNELARRAAEDQRRKFNASDRPSTIEIKPRTITRDDFPWSSEGNGESPVALVRPEGNLPYLKLFDRCVIFPPFFACGIGKLPPPRGDLFDAMNDPRRPEGSVPTIDEGKAEP